MRRPFPSQSRGFSRALPIGGLVLAAALGLAACDTAEERAEGHYERALAFIEEGEAERAEVEFRNVFRLNGDHTPARLAYAQMLEERGDVAGAFSQYLRLVEQDWSSAAGHRRLAELAVTLQDFERLETHAEAAYALDPEDPRIRVLKATLLSQRGEWDEAAAMAEDVLGEIPDSLLARMVLIAERAERGDYQAALARIEAAEALDPDDEGLAYAKLAVLERSDDTAAVGAQLEAMAARWPENASLHIALVRWHLEAGDIETAEALVRARAAEAPGDAEAQFALVGFLSEQRGPAAAAAELEAMIETAEDPVPLEFALASLEAAEGRVASARDRLEAVVARSEPSDERRAAQVALAQIYDHAGEAGARDALVDVVLDEDATHVGALKLRARRAIEADRPEAALDDLRRALNQEPRDAEAITLMAIAYEREGSHELARERLALAVDVSGRGVEEALRYARFLSEAGRTGVAAQVLDDALRIHREHPELLAALGQIRLAQGEWAQADRVAARLAAVAATVEGTPAGQAATARAAEIQATALAGQDRLEDAIAVFGRLDGGDGRNARAMAGVVEAYLQTGNRDGARRYLAAVLDEDPENLAARLLDAGLNAVEGDLDAATAAYEAILADMPDHAPAHRALHGVLVAQGDLETAAVRLDEGIAATGGDPELMFARASLLEAKGDFEGAIEVYEALYARDGSSLVIANNLASLLATHRSDAESLERAFAIGRRLRGTQVPYFQDTYGWLLATRGEDEEAIGYLRSAARALPDEPLVQYHLGVVQHRLGERAAARASLERALAAAGPDSDLPQMARARALLAEIDGDAAPAAPEREAAR